MTRSSKYISSEGATVGSARTEPYPELVRGRRGETAETAEEVVLDVTETRGAVAGEGFTGTVIAGDGIDRVVVDGVEVTTTDAEVGRVVGEVTAVAAARLEAW